MGVYRVELAPSARATCKNTECKNNQVKIPKGDLRFCTQTEISGNVSWAYKHWGCTTPQQIKNLKDSIEDNIDYLDGFDELPSELKPKILKALEDGHVDDSDWRGDLSQNRPGSTSFRSPASKKSKKKSKSEDNKDENDDGSPAPAPKKRGRGKKTEDTDDNNEPPSKKAKAVSKKANSNKNGETVAKEETDVPRPKTARRKEKKAEIKHDHELAPSQAENDSRGAESKSPAKKKRFERNVVTSTEVHGGEQGNDMEGETPEEPKAKKNRKKSGKKDLDGSGEASKETETTSANAEANIEVEKPKKARGRPRARVS